NILGTDITQLANLTPVREFGTGDAATTRPEQFNLKPGETISHDGVQGRLANETASRPGALIIRRVGTTSITPEQFAAANPGRTAKIGEQVEIPVGTGGEKDGGWVVQGTK